MRILKYISAFAFFVLFNSFLIAQCTHEGDHECIDEKASCCAVKGWNSHRPDGNAPIGVMADHYHHKGGMMVSYRYMNMNMKGNLSGTNNISDAAIYQYYMAAPKDMNMQMHMVGAMYAPTNRITLAAMFNYQLMDMNSTIMGGENSYHATSGFGDIKVNAIVGLWKAKRQSFHMNGGLNIPTGDINQSSPEPMEHMGMSMSKYPYRMQLGSGTWDVLLGATYLAQSDQFSFGAQIASVLRTGENANGYRFGNVYQLTSWGAYKATDWLSFSIRGVGSYEGEMTGSDADLEAIMSPATDSDNFGGYFVNAFGGLNIYIPKGVFSGLSIGFEYGLPLYQNVNEIQMKRTGVLNAGIKYSLF